MIPRVARFIWFGERFPWVNVLALRSALRAGGFERVVLHHDADLSGSLEWDTLTADPRFSSQRLDLDALWSEVGALGSELASLFSRLRAPAARANLVRAALLYGRGGVYLDTDTVTVASFAPLCAKTPVFCGAEPIAWPRRVLRSRSPWLWSRALALHLGRDLLRRAPGGWRLFPYLEGLYFPAVNNAVFAAAPRHPFVRDLLDAMITLPAERQLQRFALGTHLLQERVAQADPAEVKVYPSRYFYPLAPEISEHWFRLGGRPDLTAALSPETRTVHWYASVRTRAIVPQIDPAYIRRHAGEQLFSALASPFLEGAPSGA